LKAVCTLQQHHLDLYVNRSGYFCTSLGLYNMDVVSLFVDKICQSTKVRIDTTQYLENSWICYLVIAIY